VQSIVDELQVCVRDRANLMQPDPKLSISVNRPVFPRFGAATKRIMSVRRAGETLAISDAQGTEGHSSNISGLSE